MASIPEHPEGPDLDALRKDIDELKETPTEELVEPTPAVADEVEPTPERTEAPSDADGDAS